MRIVAPAIAAFLIAALHGAPASAETLSPAQIVQRHVGSGGDIDRIMADYADDAVVFQHGRAVQGKPAIRAMFEKMFPPRRTDAPPRPAAGPGIAPRIWEEGDVGFMVGQLGPVTLTEQYLVRNGKIVLQTIYIGAPSQAQTTPQQR